MHGTASATLEWQGAAEAANHEFEVRAWYDCNENGEYDEEEPHRIVDLTVITINVTSPDCVEIGESITFKATTTPSEYAEHIEWSHELNKVECSDAPPSVSDTEKSMNNSASFYEVTIDEESDIGEIQATATLSDFGCYATSELVNITCCCPSDDLCSTSGTDSDETCSSCSASAGSTCEENKSVEMNFNLGRTYEGKNAGIMYVKAEKPSLSLAMTHSLHFSGDLDSVDIVKTTGGVYQVKAPQVLADLVTINDFMYEVRFYYSEDVLKNGEGVYFASCVPFVKYLVENPSASTNDYDALLIREVKGGVTNLTCKFIWCEASQRWDLLKGAMGSIMSINSKSEVSDGTNKVVTTYIMDGASNTVLKAEDYYYSFAFGEKHVRNVRDPEDTALTSTYSYYTNAANVGSYGKRSMAVNPDGSWTRYNFDTNGSQTLKVFSFKDYPANAPATDCRVREYGYMPVDTNDNGSYYFGHPRTITEKIQDKTVSKTYYAYYLDNGEKVKITERCAAPSSSYGATNNIRTTRRYYSTNATPECAQREIKTVIYSDGRKDSYSYAYGTYTTNSDPAQCQFTTNSTGSYIRTTVTRGLTTAPSGVANKTTQDVSVQDSTGNTVQRETYVYTGSGYERIDWAVSYFDELGRRIKQYQSDGSVSDATWGCCGKTSEIDERGNERSYSYDSLKRMDLSVKQGIAAGEYAAQSNIYETTTYNAAGRVLSRTTTAGGLTQTTSNSYDTAGRLISRTDNAGIETIYQYSANGLTSTVIRSGLTNVTVQYKDGRTKFTAQNGIRQQTYDYGANADNTQWTMTYTGPSGTNSPMWRKTTTDMLGRTTKEERPGYGGTVLTSRYYYNSKGQMTRSTSPGMADNLYEYDSLGNRISSGLDVDDDGNLDLAGPDRITGSDSFYWYGDPGLPSRSLGEGWWRVSTSVIYPEESGSTPLTNSISKTRLTGLGDTSDLGLLTGESISRDIRGNETLNQTWTDRDNAVRVSLVDTPDSTNTSASISVNGLMVESETKTGLTYTYGYDALGRRTGVTDPRTGTSVTHYNDKGRVDWTRDAATNYTYYAYDQNTGRRTAVTNALGKVTRYAYDTLGRTAKTWGDTTYPVSYSYDDYGRMVAMNTYRNGQSWSDEDWPANTGTADTTQWLYDQASGVLTNKLYADGNGTAYTYTPEGKLSTRTWARGVTTTYLYDDCCGALTNVSYGQSLVDAPITYTYNRIGQQTSARTGTGATHVALFTYDPDTLALTNETIVAGGVTSVITRTRDTYGRASGLSLSAPGVGAESYSANYSYSPLGRFETIDSAVQGVTNNWQYSYLANSALLSAVSNNMSHSSHRFYEPNRNLLTEIHNTAATNATISTFTYSNDPLGRRTLRIDRTGDSQVALTNDFGYNTRSELTNALMDTESFGYNFDNIGNRELYTTNGTEYTYLVNALNQYTNIVNGITNSPTYDADGNMLTHNGWGYSWSGENRLQTASNATYNASFQYDSQGRRFQKVANGVTNVFVYDGWNLIQERETSATNATPVTTYYTWGLDLSGSMQGAGGIGGLLSVTEATASETNTYFPCFDANGNITEYVDETGTNVVAHYEYGPFGQIIAQSGTKADDFHFRFSTKYYDTETDLYYYGYRYYSPTLGRWPSRDPLEEGGGFNLYAFAENASVLWFDGFGLTIKYLPLPQRTIDYPLVKSKAGSITIDIAYRCTVALKYESGSCDMELLTSKKYQGLDCEVQDVELEFPIPYASIGLVDQLPIPKWVKALIKKGTKGKFKAGFKGRASASGDLLPVGGTVKLKQLNAYSSWKCPKGQHRRAHKLTANAVLSSLEVDLTIVGYFSDKKKDDLYTKHLDDLPGLQVDIDETIWSTCCPCPVKKDEPCQQCGGSGN